MRSPALRISTRRIGIARAVILVAFLALAARAVHLAFDPRSLQRAAVQAGATLRIAAERGQIVDRDGAELAVSVDSPSVFARPREVTDVERTARTLARPLGMSRRRLAARLQRSSRFVFLKRWVSPAAAEAVRALELPGVGIALEPRRTYPHGVLAAQVLGFANIDGEGVRGVEQQEDHWLRGTPRAYRVERDAKGQLLGIAGVQHAAAAGGDVRLTLDAGFQADAEAALVEAVRASGARGGIVVTLDPHGGDVLALAERPTFDPNRFREVPYPATRSRAFQDALEPGSTFKAFLVAGALDAGVVSPHDRIDTEGGRFRVPGKTIQDTHPHGVLSPAEVLVVSSNVGAVKVAQALGAERHFRALRAFGFGRPTGSGFPFESAGLLRSWQKWRPVDQATVAFGQGVSVTPMQLAAAAGALANGGELVAPRLVAARRRPGGAWSRTQPERVRRVLSEETARSVVAMLEGVVGPEGTARRAALRGVRVAGKTGTAQILERETGTYSTTRYHAWFVGIVPADDPRLVIVSMLDEPRLGLHHGGSSAGPLFARVASAQLARLGIVTEPARRPPAVPAPVVAEARPPATPPAAARTLPRPRREALTSDGRAFFLPDLRGLTMAEVKAITDASRLDVEIVGEGRVVDQEPDPGTVLSGGAHRVRLHLDRDGGEEG
jgi:cell division protein FtsI (penicillin-binding protein 3)